MTNVYNLAVCSIRPSDGYRLRSLVRSFLEKRGGCEITGAGMSCIDPSCTDLAVRFKSKSIAASSITALRAAYSDVADIEVSS